jgi:hypothetical protein
MPLGLPLERRVRHHVVPHQRCWAKPQEHGHHQKRSAAFGFCILVIVARLSVLRKYGACFLLGRHRVPSELRVELEAREDVLVFGQHADLACSGRADCRATAMYQGTALRDA